MLVAACGSDDDAATEPADTTPAETAPAETEPTETEPDDDMSDTTEAVETTEPETTEPDDEDILARYLLPPDDLSLPTAPLSARPDGKTVMYLYLGLPVPTLLADEMQVAASELGVDLVSVQFASCGEEFTAAFDRAVTEQPDGVMFGSCPPDAVTEQINELQANGIPVVAHGVATTPDADFPVIAGAETFQLNGDLAGRFIAAESEEPEDVLLVGLPTVAVLSDNFGPALEASLAEVCPECNLVREDVTPQLIGQGQVPGLITNALQANPDIQWVVFEGASSARGVPEALDSAGIDVDIITLGGESVNWQYMRDGEQTADLANPLGMVVWRTMDLMARQLAGDDVTAEQQLVSPTQILLPDTVPGPDNGPFWQPGDYQSEFKALWAG